MSSNTAVPRWRRASDPIKYLAFSWELCPPEILWMVFRNLNGKALLACMTVSRRWKDIVMDYIEYHNLWEKIVSEEMVNRGCTFRTKSTLNSKEMLINSKLWSSVALAQIDLYHTYDLNDIIKMHVYKDNLILMTDDNISYFNVKDKEIIRFYDCSSRYVNQRDYCENDYVIVILEQYEEHQVDLQLYGKRYPNDCSFHDSLMYVMNGILLFRLEDNTCYVITNKYIVWALTWNNEAWEVRLKGRYYGNVHDTICAMHVSNKRVSMVTKSGLILCEDPKSKKFDKVFSYHNQLWPDTATNCVLFNQSDVVVSVSPKNQRIHVYHDSDFNRMTVQCADMTCATEHGEVLFIGYRDGTVAICLPNAMKINQGKPQRLLKIQDFDQNILDPAILALEVGEDKMSHHLFVAVRHKVLQLLITYPDGIKEWYE